MELTLNKNLTKVEPTLPVAPYLGGKSRLAKRIISKINKIEHKIYAEVFVGMGGIFFRRDRKPKSEIINDFNGEVTNLFRILNEHYPQFMDVMKYQITSRAGFNRLVKVEPQYLTDLQRAARFLYLQRTSFGGKVAGQNFGVSKDRPARFDLNKLTPMLEDVHERLSGVVIECLSYENFIPRYDSKDTLFYLDPPYFNGENDYGKGMFKRSDYQKMSDVLKSIEGKFILSINNVPEIREIFKSFNQEEVELNYSVAVKSGYVARELIISNHSIVA